MRRVRELLQAIAWGGWVVSKGKRRVTKRVKSGASKASATTAGSVSTPTTPAPKPTQAEQVDRVGEIITMIREGRGSRREVLRHAASAWGIASRQTDEYLARAKAELRAMVEADAVEARAEVMAWYREQYKRACDRNDLKAAIQAARELAKLLGLDASGRAMLARAGLDSALKDKLDSADSQAADILRQVYPGGER